MTNCASPAMFIRLPSWEILSNIKTDAVALLRTALYYMYIMINVYTYNDDDERRHCLRQMSSINRFCMRRIYITSKNGCKDYYDDAGSV